MSSEFESRFWGFGIQIVTAFSKETKFTCPNHRFAPLKSDRLFRFVTMSLKSRICRSTWGIKPRMQNLKKKSFWSIQCDQIRYFSNRTNTLLPVRIWIPTVLVLNKYSFNRLKFSPNYCPFILLIIDLALFLEV